MAAKVASAASHLPSRLRPFPDNSGIPVPLWDVSEGRRHSLVRVMLVNLAMLKITQAWELAAFGMGLALAGTKDRCRFFVPQNDDRGGLAHLAWVRPRHRLLKCRFFVPQNDDGGGWGGFGKGIPILQILSSRPR